MVSYLLTAMAAKRARENQQSAAQEEPQSSPLTSDNESYEPNEQVRDSSVAGPRSKRPRLDGSPHLGQSVHCPSARQVMVLTILHAASGVYSSRSH